MFGVVTFDLGAMTGAIVGAAVAVAGSIYVARYLDGEQDRRKMRAAMLLVGGEMDDNAVRVDANHVKSHLTYGNWSQGKEALSALALRKSTEELWKELLFLYGLTYEASHGRGTVPSSEDLRAAAGRLSAEHDKLAQELQYGWLRGMVHTWAGRYEEETDAGA